MAVNYKDELAKLINSMQSEGMDLQDIEVTIYETIIELTDDIRISEVTH